MTDGSLLCDIWFPGKPRGKGRQNFMPRPRTAGAGVKINGAMYYPMKAIGVFPRPASTADYERDLQMTIIQQMRKQGHFRPEEGAVELRFCAFYPPVKSDNKRVTLQKQKGLIPRLSTPDVDNLGKIICDAANTYVFNDDRQVVKVTGAKVFSHHEGIRARFYKYDIEGDHAWLKTEFPWSDEGDFKLEG